MSRQIGMDCIGCRPTPRPAHVEYSMEYHASLIRKVTGGDVAPGGVSKDAADSNCFTSWMPRLNDLHSISA